MAAGDRAETDGADTLVPCVTAGVPQLRTPRRRSFTAAKQRVFLDTLAATCNVRIAAEAAGVCFQTVFRVRRRDERFAALWTAALAVGHAQLEAAALRYAIEAISVDDEAFDPAAAPPEMVKKSRAFRFEKGRPTAEDLRFVHHVLSRAQAAVTRGHTSIKVELATEDETNAALRTLLATVARRKAASGDATAAATS